MTCSSISVWLWWLDAQHSHLPATSSTNHKGDSKRGHDAADVPWHQYNSARNGHHVATQQAVLWLCKCPKRHKLHQSNSCLDYINTPSGKSNHSQHNFWTVNTWTIFLELNLCIFFKLQFYWNLMHKMNNVGRVFCFILLTLLCFVRSLSASTQRSISLRRFPASW